MAAKLQCEICGGKLIGKPGGIFECEYCGTEYSTEWAKAKIQEIKGTVKVEGTVDVKGKVEVEGTTNAKSLIKRGNLALEDRKWNDAKKYFDDALNAVPENAEAYLGKLMADLKVSGKEHLAEYKYESLIFKNDNYKKAIRFADDTLKNEINGYIEFIKNRNSEEKYVEACKLLESGEVNNLLSAAYKFERLGDYKDSAELAEKSIKASEEKSERNRERLAEPRKRIAQYYGMIAAGKNQITGLKSDGTVVATSSHGQCNVKDWTDIVAIAEGDYHTVGLKSDGTVVAVGENDKDQCNVEGWKDIVAIAAGNHTVGLKSDGTVIVGPHVVKNWTDIVAIAAGYSHTVGLKSDGTVVATGNNSHFQCDVKNWTNIVSIAAGSFHTVGLKSDGTVVGEGLYGQSDVVDWTDIVAIAAGGDHTVGLKSDGTVVADGRNISHQCDVEDWTDIVAIAAGGYRTVGLKSDGTVVATGSSNYGVRNWKLFKTEEEKQADYAEACALQESDEENNLKKAADLFIGIKDFKDSAERNKACNIALYECEKAKLQEELANLKGLFTGKRRKEIEARLSQIESELKSL